jgi:hypothetical protein
VRELHAVPDGIHALSDGKRRELLRGFSALTLILVIILLLAFSVRAMRMSMSKSMRMTVSGTVVASGKDACRYKILFKRRGLD